jgi:hypothetical protein
MGGQRSIAHKWMHPAVLIVVTQCKADPERNLVMRDLAVFDMAARLHHLEPADLAQRARGAADGVMDRTLNTLPRRACDLDDSVDVIGHPLFPHDKTRWKTTQLGSLQNACARIFSRAAAIKLRALSEGSCRGPIKAQYEKLLRALLSQAFYSVRSERQLAEQLESAVPLVCRAVAG